MKRSPLKFDLPRAWFALLLLLAMGCEPRVALSPLPEGGVILAFGDSLTAGVGASAAQSYPIALEALSARRVVNAGVSGETTDGGLRRLPSVLHDVSPDLMILMEGGNDILRSVNAQRTRDNLSAMIELARAAGVAVVLIGVPDKMLFSDSAGFYQELAESLDLVFMDGELADLLRDSRYKSDPIHLNTEGYALLAQAIYETLQEHGAL